jgi:hypothetical protein
LRKFATRGIEASHLVRVDVLAETQRAIPQGQDRRSKPRICVAFYAKVEGLDDEGDQFSIETILDNISGNGLYLRLIPCVDIGTKLAIVVGLRTLSKTSDETIRFRIDGVVKRVEERAGGAYGVAVGFEHVRFF